MANLAYNCPFSNRLQELIHAAQRPYHAEEVNSAANEQPWRLSTLSSSHHCGRAKPSFIAYNIDFSIPQKRTANSPSTRNFEVPLQKEKTSNTYIPQQTALNQIQPSSFTSPSAELPLIVKPLRQSRFVELSSFEKLSVNDERPTEAESLASGANVTAGYKSSSCDKSLWLTGQDQNYDYGSNYGYRLPSGALVEKASYTDSYLEDDNLKSLKRRGPVRLEAPVTSLQYKTAVCSFGSAKICSATASLLRSTEQNGKRESVNENILSSPSKQLQVATEVESYIPTKSRITTSRNRISNESDQLSANKRDIEEKNGSTPPLSAVNGVENSLSTVSGLSVSRHVNELKTSSLRRTSHKGSREPVKKTWYSSSVDTPVNYIHSSTLPRSFPGRSRIFEEADDSNKLRLKQQLDQVTRGAAIQRSRSFMYSAEIPYIDDEKYLSNSPQHQVGIEKILNYSPQKPARNFMHFNDSVQKINAVQNCSLLGVVEIHATERKGDASSESPGSENFSCLSEGSQFLANALSTKIPSISELKIKADDDTTNFDKERFEKRSADASNIEHTRNQSTHSVDSGCFIPEPRKDSSELCEIQESKSSFTDKPFHEYWQQRQHCDNGYSSDDEPVKAPTVRRRNSLVVRTQTGLRVKTVIDKLLSSAGRDQRRALFSLKQIFQDDKDLVHEFVQNGGLQCMIKLGRQADQNHQNYILRALGQLMLYVDGMNGIIAHIETIQWLYELLDSPYRLVVKTALKLLLVFIEYTDHNALLLMTAVTNVDKSNNRPDWFALMKVLSEKDASDVEMLTYGMTVINKTLNGVSDQDTYYDIVDALESQGLEDAMKQMVRLGSKELTDQCKLYEKVLKQEDEADSNEESNLVKMRNQPSVQNLRENIQNDRRTVMRRRHQESLARQQEHQNFHKINAFNNNIEKFETPLTNGSVEPAKIVPPWRRKFSEENAAVELEKNNNLPVRSTPAKPPEPPVTAQPHPKPIVLTERNEQENNENVEPEKPVRAPPPSFPSLFSPTENKTMEFPDVKKEKEKEKGPESEPSKPTLAKAKVVEDDDDGGGGNVFAAQLRRRAAKAAASNAAGFEPKQSEAETQWKKAAENFKSKPLIINDLDFSEFHKDEFEQDPLVMARLAVIAQEKGLLPGTSSEGPPKPPAIPGGPPPAPPPLPGAGGAPPPPPLLTPMAANRGRETSPSPQPKTSTLKLHWKPAQAEPPPVPSLKNKGTFWHKLDLPPIDTNKLAQLFEQKAKESTPKRLINGGEHKPQILQVLSLKRSQAINIGLTKLPPINVIPAAIMKFDSLVLNKEGIEKILSTMMPSPAEIEAIEIKQAENPEMQLGTAEQFLLKLSQIPCLLERLRLWAFTLDYKNSEKDIAEPLMDLQLAMKEIEESKTFRTAMGMLLSIGNTINGTNIKGFQLDYLTKASEVKDPVYKHTLTYHLAEYMIEHCPDGSDLYSEFGAVARSARVDYDELESNLKKLEQDCKASWEYLAKISKNDSSSSMKQKINDYLTDVAQRILQLKAIYRIALNRWHAFLLFFGYSIQEVPTLKPMQVCKMVIEFALEYRTTRDKILQQRKRLADKRERNKTRGKIWALEGQETKDGAEPISGRRRAPVQMNAQQRHEEMSRMLTGGDDTLRRTRGARPTPERSAASIIANQREMLRSVGMPAESTSPGGESPDDEILDGLVKAATVQSEPRDHRRRARQFNRKSLRRTRTLKLVDDQLGTTLSNA